MLCLKRIYGCIQTSGHRDRLESHIDYNFKLPGWSPWYGANSKEWNEVQGVRAYVDQHPPCHSWDVGDISKGAVETLKSGFRVD